MRAGIVNCLRLPGWGAEVKASAVVQTGTEQTELVVTQPVAAKRYKPEGKTAKTFAAERKKTRSSSAYQSWKRRLSFWPRKGFLLLELSLFITLGVFIGQILEVSGSMRFLSVLTLPLTALGKIRREAGPAFLMAFQSGAVANSMLVAQRDSGSLNNRELYTSIYVVSALSLFAHLPTFVVPIGVAFGWEATIALFSVRFSAIAIQVVVTLVLSRLFVERLFPSFATTLKLQAETEVRQPRQRQGGFWTTVWKRSHKTLRRLLIYLIPTFICMATLEYLGFSNGCRQPCRHFFIFISAGRIGCHHPGSGLEPVQRGDCCSQLYRCRTDQRSSGGHHYPVWFDGDRSSTDVTPRLTDLHCYSWSTTGDVYGDLGSGDPYVFSFTLYHRSYVLLALGNNYVV